MNNVLIYSRSKKKENIAEQTASILSSQLHLVGLSTEITHSLNIPRLILNPYQVIHFIVENLPLTVNEAFHLAICKALGKATVLSVLNSEKKLNRNLLNIVKPDAFSASQTNHLKLYRGMNCSKFILSGYPKCESTGKKSSFSLGGFLIPIQNSFDEIFRFDLNAPIYFDGRKLLLKNKSALLRKQWSELIASKKIGLNFNLILSDSKIEEILSEGGLAVVIADPTLLHTEQIAWMNQALNRNNLLVLNEFQATGFSSFWTSGQNCLVLGLHDWTKRLSQLESKSEYSTSSFKSSELFESSVNELSRLYSKLWHQKTSLLTSGSVKL